MRIIGYVRVSTNDQAENGVSLDAQAEKIRAYCKATGSQCVGIVPDDGASAKDLKRPGLQQILEEIPQKARRFDGIVVTKLARASTWSSPGPEEDEDNAFCIPCTRAKLGLKKQA